jgi:hypothetical protein
LEAASAALSPLIWLPTTLRSSLVAAMTTLPLLRMALP